MAATLMVTYPASTGTRLDRNYDVATHLPLVRERWTPHGLEDATGYFRRLPARC